MLPMVVLINAGSASASRNCLPAPCATRSGLLLWANVLLEGFRAKHNSACRWFGPQADSCPLLYPNGSSIQAEGIVPDLEVVFEPPRQDDKDNPRMLLRERGFEPSS